MSISDSLILSGGPYWSLGWTLGVVTAGLILFYLAWNRPKDRLRALRVGATGVALISLLIIGLQPGTRYSPLAYSDAILVTDGATQETLRALSDSLGMSVPVYAVNGSADLSNVFSAVVHLPDAEALNRYGANNRNLLVVGHGLTSFEWSRLQNFEITEFFAPLPNGITAVHWADQVVLGRPWTVSGRFASPVTGSLSLIGPDGIVDSLHIVDQQTFMLKTYPKAPGRHLYSLCLSAKDEQSSFSETIGLSVVERSAFAVLILESTPQFETRYLKNWLGDLGGSLAIRSKVSQDRYRTDFVNRENIELNRITLDVLSSFDVLLTDHQTLQAFSRRERNAVFNAVRTQGLGLLIDPAAANSAYTSWSTSERRFFEGFNAIPVNNQNPDVDPQWENRPNSLPASLPKSPFSLQPISSSRTLIVDESGKPLTSSLQRGLGKVAVSLIEETYRWIIQDHQLLYEAYWAHLFSELARPTKEDAWLWSREAPLHINHPIQISLSTLWSDPTATIIPTDGQAFPAPLRQDPILPTLWTSTFWADSPGWYGLTSGEDTTWMYVYPDSAWTSMQQQTRTTATQHHQQTIPVTKTEEAETRQVQTQPVKLLPFFILFFASCLFLWIEYKL